LYSDVLRSWGLYAVALVFALIALSALVLPEAVALAIGYFLNGVNSYSEFYAVYVGVWSATAALAFSAARQVRQPMLGDLTAMFVLAQPVGRMFAALAVGLPQGFLLIVCAFEIVGGLLLLFVRPSH
jgi:hypothetical protein